MDLTSTSKRAREPSDDEEATPRKQPASSALASTLAENTPSTSASSSMPAIASGTQLTPPQRPSPPQTIAAAAQHRAAVSAITGKARKRRKRRQSDRGSSSPATQNNVRRTSRPSPQARHLQRIQGGPTAREGYRGRSAGTALFRPSGPDGTFRGTPRLTLAAPLSSRPGVAAVRVNYRRNIVAADAASAECLAELLTLTELNGVPVTAGKPADRRSCTGFIYGADGDFSDSQLLAAITASATVPSVTREDRAVKLRFAGTVPPRVCANIQGALPCSSGEAAPTPVPPVRAFRPCDRLVPAPGGLKVPVGGLPTLLQETPRHSGMYATVRELWWWPPC